MTQRIERHTLSLGENISLRYALFRGETSVVQASPLLLCLHPGWGGEFPPVYYGEQFLSSVFIPAFSETGATIVSLDCPSGAWNNQVSRQAILKLLDHLKGQHEIDQTRVSLVGYSAGGWGVWYMLQENDDQFSSAILFATLPVIDPVDRFEDNFPKCRELLTSRLEEWLDRVPKIPIYIVHSIEDELLPYADANRAYQALAGVKRQVKFETVQGAGHFEGERYIEPLYASIPWLLDTWKLHKQD